MKIHRFIGNFDLSGKTLEITDKELTHQITRVLKLKTEEKMILSDGKGNESMGTITSLSPKIVTVELSTKEKSEAEPKRQVTLFQAILKRENFEYVCQKAVECGITKIVPVLTERTIKSGLNRERLQKIMHEAAEQSGRATVPHLENIISYDEALKLCESKETILLDNSGVAFRTLNFTLSTLNCFIGPEGGFTEKEIAEAKTRNIQICSLGARTLRGETAAIITSYLFANL